MNARSSRPHSSGRPNKPKGHSKGQQRGHGPNLDSPANPQDSAEASRARAFSWYPGHMAKALRQLEQNLELADVVLLVMDARIPASSRQPEIEELLRRKNREMLLVLNKADLADEDETKRWKQRLASEGHRVVIMRATAGKGAGSLTEHICKLRAAVDAKRQQKGLLPRDPRLVVAGIPNVGKSSLLNRLAGANRAKTGAKPGVTRGNQWVAVPGKWQVLDSPGILYPRIEGETALTNLAATSCVSLDAVPIERVGSLLLLRLAQLGKLEPYLGRQLSGTSAEMLDQFAQIRNFLLNGDELDLTRAARMLMKDFAQGAVGRVTLEPAYPESMLSSMALSLPEPELG